MTEKKAVDDGTSKPQLAFVNRGLFSDHFLQARLPEWKEWDIDTELVSFHDSLRSLYDSKKPILTHLNEAQTELEFVQPVLDLLGYSNSYIVQAPTKVGQHTNRPDYALFPDVNTKNKAYQKLDQNDYSHCIGIADAKYWERELDIAKAIDRDTFTNQNPSFQIAAYLTGTKQNWGILTNGRIWRLYSSKSDLPLGNYYQVDLVQILEEAPIDVLKYFYVLFRKQALLQVEGKSLLDRIFEGSEEYAVELEADIKERAYSVVELLCRGFTTEFTHAQLTDAALKNIYDNSLTLLYRLLFVFYAEARELLPLTANASYRENYSLRKLSHDIDETMKKGYELSASSTQYYHYINNLFNLINNGDSKLGVPEYNGGLFDPTEHPFLEKQAIPDAYLVQAVHQLARIIDKKLGREVAVDYNTLSERHLGSIYEGLLEFKPMIAPHDLVTVKDKGSIKYAPAKKHPANKIAYTKGELYLANDKGERKASGSYYTPEYIVNYIVENTLDPLVEEAHEKIKALKPEVDKAIAKWQNLKEQKQGLEPTEKYDQKITEESERLLEPYLLLKVLDPAMGSGHFLARATDFLAEAIATDPDIKSPLELTEESELTYYRRRVVENCIYGVDLNPLAVELAKLTLWLTTMAKSKPLSFLNHHLRVGNSLIGARIADLDEIPKAKGKKKAIDPSRAPVQLGLFQEVFNKKLYDLLQNRALIAKLPTETLADVHNKQKWERMFEHNVDRFRTLANVWVSTFFGNDVAWDSYNTLVEKIQVPDSEWEKLLQKKYAQNALAGSKEKRYFHWELEFPEVFYDEQGKRKADAGFDAVMGNPPYIAVESITDVDRKYFTSTFSFLRRKYDIMVLFLNIIEYAVKLGGRIGMIVPVIWQTGENYIPFRQHFLGGIGKIDRLVNLPFDVFPEAYVDTCILIAYHVIEIPVSYEFLGLSYPKYSTAFDISSTQHIEVSVNTLDLKNGSPLIIGNKEKIQILEKCKSNSDILDNISACTQGPVESFLELLHIEQGTKDSEPYAVPAVDRYHLEIDSRQFVRGFDADSYQKYYEKPRILVRRILSRQDRLLAAVAEEPFVCKKDFNPIVVIKPKYSKEFLLSLLNSRLFSWLYITQSTISLKDDFRQTTLSELKRLPIKHINFMTPKEQRVTLGQQARKLYQEYLGNQNWDSILAFVAERLHAKKDGTPNIEHEQSDVIHDLLAFLAKEMTRLNEEKQLAIKHFLTWLEKEIIKGSIEDQKNKTKIKNFHEGTLEELMDILKKNKVIPAPCPSNIWDTIASEFSTTMNMLSPLKNRVMMTDKLIDQIVYKLYNLNNEEIAIVEGNQTNAEPTKNEE